MTKNYKRIIYTDRSTESMNNFLKEINRYKLLTPEEEYDLWKRMKEGSVDARNQLICCNLRFAVTIAKKYYCKGLSLEDRVGIACLGMNLAADKFDATKGMRFISFAKFYMLNELAKEVKGNHETEELDACIDNDDENEFTLYDLLQDKNAESPDSRISQQVMRDSLEKFCDQIRHVGARNIFNDYVTMSEKGYTLGEVAQKYGLTVSQLKEFLGVVEEEAVSLLRDAA